MVSISGINIGDIVTLEYKPVGSKDDTASVVGYVYALEGYHIRLSNFNPLKETLPWNNHITRYSCERIISYKALEEKKELS